MALTANANGVITGKFTIPEKVTAGSKAVQFTGSGGSFGSATFFGQGTLIENVMQKVTRQTVTYYDPVAQTFYLDEMRQTVGVDLFVVKKGTTPITVHIRETSNGYPAQTVVAEATLRPAAITAGAWNRWTFPMPTTLLAGTEYAVVVMCGDAVAEIGICEMGKWGIESQRWVTSQNPNVGVMFTSSNNSTWTAHQDKDIAMKLLVARYTQTSRSIGLGHVVTNTHTDAVVLASADVPNDATRFSVTLDPPGKQLIETGDGQAVQFAPAVTGNMPVTAIITATQKVSAVLLPGTQIALGLLQNTGTYISRAFDADAAESNVRVTFEAILPSGSNVRVYLADETDPASWGEIFQDGTPIALGDGRYEFTYRKADFNKARCRVRLVLSGTTSARPQVMNLRASVI